MTTITACRCEKCGSDRRVDIYNNFDDQPGVAICDECILAEARAVSSGSEPLFFRPEGYYHCALEN